jgi:hypothetical protein
VDNKMNSTFAKLAQLNSAVTREDFERMFSALISNDTDGVVMLCERFNIPRQTAQRIAYDVRVEGYDLHERIDTMLDDMGVPRLEA